MSKEKKSFAFYGQSVTLYAPDISKQWYIYWYDNGKRVRLMGNINTGATHEQRTLLAEALASQVCAGMVKVESPTKKRMYELMNAKKYDWRESTMMTVKSIVDVLWTWLGARTITAGNMEAFFQHLKETRHPTTYNNYRLWLARFCKEMNLHWAMDGVAKMKSEKTPKRFFQPHQIAKLKAYIELHDPELWTYIQFVYYCGIRPSRELPKMKAGDILIEEQKIVMAAGTSKNKKHQYIVIPDNFMPALAFIYDLAPGDYLFPSPKNKLKPIGRNTMNRRHADILKVLRFGEGYSLYSWKHTGAVMAHKAGATIKEIQLQLRHHSLDQTNQYLRQMGILDMGNLRASFPKI